MSRINQTAKKNSRSLRRELTDAEQLLWRYLRMRQMGGCKFRRQHPLGRYILDFVCLEAGLVIEKWMECNMRTTLSGIRAGLNGWSNRSYGCCDSGIMTC